MGWYGDGVVMVMVSIVTGERKGWKRSLAGGHLSLSALKYGETSSLTQESRCAQNGLVSG